MQTDQVAAHPQPAKQWFASVGIVAVAASDFRSGLRFSQLLTNHFLGATVTWNTIQNILSGPVLHRVTMMKEEDEKKETASRKRPRPPDYPPPRRLVEGVGGFISDDDSGW